MELKKAQEEAAAAAERARLAKIADEKAKKDKAMAEKFKQLALKVVASLNH